MTREFFNEFMKFVAEIRKNSKESKTNIRTYTGEDINFISENNDNCKNINPIKGHKYLLNYYKVVPIRYMRGTYIATDYEVLNYSDIYEYLGHNHYYCDNLGKDISINKKEFNKILAKEVL